MEQRLMRPSEAAQFLGVSRSKVYEMVAAKEIPSIRLAGGSIRVPAAQLAEWLDNRIREQADPGAA